MTFANQDLAPREPDLDIDEIQGNVLPGFMKPHMTLLSLRITDIGLARTYLAELSERVTTLRHVWPSRKAVRAARTLQPTRATVAATPSEVTHDVWLNVAVTYRALAEKLDNGILNLAAFEDPAFTAGLPTRSALLGDPVDAGSPGHPDNWVVGGPGQEPDVLLIVAADDDERLTARIAEERGAAEEHKLYVLHEDSGHKLGDTETGKEHFGFQDGISQPGVRGRVVDEFLAHRCIDPSQVPDTHLYGLPGQLLVWPGEFVFGYPAASPDPLVSGAIAQPGPAWSRNGSYLVYRRLRQDVPAFEAFIAEQGALLREQRGFEAWSDDRLAAALVGRWKSGAPVLRAPEADDEELGINRLYNNSFGYARQTGTLQLTDGTSTAGRWPEAPGDPVGLMCPMAAHIRKVNTRETPNDMGASRASLNRRLLRRGITYGRGVDEPEATPDEDRGLLFLSYQASISRQFEFLNDRWMNSAVNPRSPSGHDMIVGQNGAPGQNRVRIASVFGEGLAPGTICTGRDFVIPTGGGYFFSPSVTALRDVLAIPGDRDFG